MGRWIGQGMKQYERLLVESQVNGTADINQHMRRPTESTSRLGFRGKKVKKADLKLIAEKLAKVAQRNPNFVKAANNMASITEGLKAQERMKQKPGKQNQIEEARKLLKQLEAKQARAVQNKSTTQTNSLDEYSLRQKLLAEQKAKLAGKLEIKQYGNVFLKPRNSPG